jgi:hypothetical protein
VPRYILKNISGGTRMIHAKSNIVPTYDAVSYATQSRYGRWPAAIGHATMQGQS